MALHSQIVPRLHGFGVAPTTFVDDDSAERQKGSLGDVDPGEAFSECSAVAHLFVLSRHPLGALLLSLVLPLLGVFRPCPRIVPQVFPEGVASAGSGPHLAIVDCILEHVVPALVSSVFETLIGLHLRDHPDLVDFSRHQHLLEVGDVLLRKRSRPQS